MRGVCWFAVFSLATISTVANARDVFTVRYVNEKWEEVEAAVKTGNCEQLAIVAHEYQIAATQVLTALQGVMRPIQKANASDLKEHSAALGEHMKKFKSIKVNAARMAELPLDLADCAEKIGDKVSALEIYTNSMDNISLSNYPLWDRAASGVYRLLEIEDIQQ